ncbi:MAG TPA: uracil phosphoribosyltransferase [Chloroflexota bacterium]|nr:uracil phosphoribosyltransferase [Chloroflexota bacterium]
MGNLRQVTVVRHPLVETSLVALRDVETGTDAFRRHARLLTLILAFHVLEDLPTREVSVLTPLEETTGRVVDRSVIFVPVLRAGLAMLDAMSDFVPGSKVGFVGLERDDETAIAHSYYEKLPAQLADAETIILDPMLATGGSAATTVDLLRDHQANHIRLACIVAAPEGVRLLDERHPDVRIYTAVVDDCLNERKYIVPGLGDFGDRYFGTT